MPPSRQAHSVHIFGHDYTVEVRSATRARLDEAARQLEQAMHAQQTRQPDAVHGQLAVLAALELICAAPHSTLDEREIANGLAALQRKLDRLEAVLTFPAPVSPEQS